MAPMSSMIARAARNTLTEAGILLPARDNMPRAKAISVAMGMAKPGCVAVPLLSKKWIADGTIIPPKAATTGIMAVFMSDSSPLYSSRSTSSPTMRKKMVISPSFTQFSTLRFSEECINEASAWWCINAA